MQQVAACKAELKQKSLRVDSEAPGTASQEGQYPTAHLKDNGEARLTTKLMVGLLAGPMRKTEVVLTG